MTPGFLDLEILIIEHLPEWEDMPNFLSHAASLSRSSWIMVQSCCITKTCLYNFDPLKPHFYIVKLGFTGVYIIFLISAQKHRLWVLVRTASLRQF